MLDASIVSIVTRDRSSELIYVDRERVTGETCFNEINENNWNLK